ncbi:MAG: energy-coupled thiamine transporter ThiT [Clostridia bacterium]|nr:energy-coupled thiamine transporter ThiT [Clostridia bacterium]
MSVPIQEYLLKLLQVKPLISLFTLVALAVVLFVVSRKTALNTRLLAYGALSMSAAFVLSYFKILQFPNGGTVTIASMLPIFIFAYIAGPAAGILLGLCYGLLQFIQDPFFVHPIQFILDYPLAFSLLGLAGFFRKNVYLGAVIGSIARLLCHFLSGAIFFGEYAPAGQSVFLYSLIYNSSYILPDMAICLGILAISNVRSAITRLKNAIA